ncbi:MAG: type II secretion system F family protein [Pseudomonadales bacterium]
MPRFAFQARDSEGRSLSGVREATDARLIAQELMATGLIPLRISEESEAEASSQGMRITLFKPRVRVDEVILLSHQMYSLTRAGISLVRALRGLAESQKNEALQAVLMDIAGRLEGGSDLASALRRYPDVFSELYASVIHVGENTGQLDQAFKQIAGYMEMERETRKRIKTATRYPMFVLGAIGIAIVILNIFVIPAFSKVFAKFHAELPWQTQVIIGISDFMVAWWPALLVCIGGLVFGVRYYVSTPVGRFNWDRAKLRLPILGSIFERINLARFCQTFAMVSKAGLPITQGLNVIARAIGNEYMADRVNTMRHGIERGAGIAQTARESGMFTPVVLQMIAVGEETGSVDELLEQAAGFYEEEVDYELKGLTDAVEPVLIIAIGIMVLVLALGVFLPLWDLSSVANH